MIRTITIPTIASLMLSLGALTACSDHGQLSEEPMQEVGEKSDALQFTDVDLNVFRFSGTIAAYPNLGDLGTCTLVEDVTGQTPVASEDVDETEVVTFETFGLEEGSYCFYVVDPGYALYYDNDDGDAVPDTVADGATITNNPADPVTVIADGSVLAPVVFNILWPQDLDELYNLVDAQFAVSADCPMGCDVGEICGTLDDDSTDPGPDPGCLTLCINNEDCELLEMDACVRGVSINQQIDDNAVEAGDLVDPASNGVCTEL